MNHVKKWLDRKNMTILELSRRARIAPSDLGQAISEKKPFFPNWRRRVSQALDIPERELFPENVRREGNSHGPRDD